MAMKSQRKRPREGAAATFHSHLQELRLTREWTQAELARRLGVERSIVANYEHGLSLPPLTMLEKLAKAFDISLDQLVFGDKKPTEAVEDREMLRLFSQADKLDYTAKAALKQVIEGLLARAATAPQHRRSAA